MSDPQPNPHQEGSPPPERPDMPAGDAGGRPDVPGGVGSQPQQPVAPAPTAPDSKKSNCLLYGGIGCVIVLIVVAVLIYLAINWGMYAVRGAGASVAQQMASQVIDESSLAPDQKQGLKQSVQGLADDFRDGDITMEQLELIGRGLTESPLIVVGVADAFAQQYIESAPLDDAQKADARLQFDRLARGIYEGSISQSSLQAITTPITITDAQGNQTIKQNPSQDELLEVIEMAQAEADAAGIPSEPWDVDVVAIFDQIIERVKRGDPPIPPGGLEQIQIDATAQDSAPLIDPSEPEMREPGFSDPANGGGVFEDSDFEGLEDPDPGAAAAP